VRDHLNLVLFVARLGHLHLKSLALVTVGRVVVTALLGRGGDLLLFRILQTNRDAFRAIAVGIGRVFVYHDALFFQQAIETEITRHPYDAAMAAEAIRKSRTKQPKMAGDFTRESNFSHYHVGDHSPKGYRKS